MKKISPNLHSAQFVRERTGNDDLGILDIGRLYLDSGFPPRIEKAGEPRPWYLAQRLDWLRIGAFIRRARYPRLGGPPRISAQHLGDRCGLSGSAVTATETGRHRPNFPHASSLLEHSVGGLIFLRLEEQDELLMTLLEPLPDYAVTLGKYFSELIPDQKSAAETIGVPQSAISNFCTGAAHDPRVSTIQDYFRAFEVSAGLLRVVVPHSQHTTPK